MLKSRTGRGARGLLVAVALFLFGGLGFAQAPEPSVTVGGTSGFLGTSVTVPVTFNNTGDVEGFGPYVEMLLPTEPVPLEFQGASYLGQPITGGDVIEIALGSGTVAHPFARNPDGTPVMVSGPPGGRLVVLVLPFGSITPGQPPITLDVAFAISQQAAPEVEIPITAVPGFRYGLTPLDEPNDQLRGPSVTASITPELVTFTKELQALQGDTPVGSTFTHRYEMTMTLAPGQTLSDLVITDFLPNALVYRAGSLEVESEGLTGSLEHDEVFTVGTGACSPTGPVDFPASDTGPYTDSSFTVSLDGPVTAGADPGTVTVAFNFYIPEVDAECEQAGDGDDEQSVNNAEFDAEWAGNDNIAGPVSVDRAADARVHIINTSDTHPEAQNGTIRLQKWVFERGRENVQAGPGDTVTFILDFQVSDISAFSDVEITDVLPDGLSVPEIAHLEYSQHGTVLHDGNITVIDSGRAEDGSVLLTFETDGALPSNLLGACVTTEEGPLNCNGGASTSGTITFTTTVLESYFEPRAASRNVVLRDVLSNTATISGTILNTVDLTSTTYVDDDDGTAVVEIGEITTTKRITHINGDLPIGDRPLVTNGDFVTFALRVDLPVTAFENLVVSDYLPLPVFRAATPRFIVCGTDAIPDANEACFSPASTIQSLISTLAPGTGSDPAANSVSFDFGSHVLPFRSQTASVLEILYTVEVQDTALADGLYLTNMLHASHANSSGVASNAQQIVQLQYTRPVLNISNGVVAVGNNTTFTPPSEMPGSVPTQVTSTIRDNPEFNLNAIGLDGDDVVTYLVIVENTGRGREGAFDIVLREELPPGLTDSDVVPGSLAIQRGNDGSDIGLPPGAVEADLFSDDGLELPGHVLGRGQTADGAEVTDGSNILYLSYQVRLPMDVENHSQFTTTSHVMEYAAQSGGVNLTAPGLITDDVYVTVVGPEPVKSIAATSEDHTTNPSVTIGEIIRYRLVVTVPEGQSTNLVVTDTLPNGLAYLDNARIAFVAGTPGELSSSTLSGVQTAATLDALGETLTATNSAGLSRTGSDQTVTFNLGDVTNSASNDRRELIVIEFNALVQNTTANSATGGQWQKNNFFTVTSGPVGERNDQRSNTIESQIVEPRLSVTKSNTATDGEVDAGDSFRYTITISNTGTRASTAYELQVVDTLPAFVVYTDHSVIYGETATDVDAVWDEASRTVTITAASLAAGGSITLVIDATLQSGVPSNHEVSNRAYAFATSLPDAGTPNNSTGLDTPGGPAAPPAPWPTTTGTTGANNGERGRYTSGSTTFRSRALTPQKSVVGSSNDGTSGSNLAIGEIVRYRLLTSIPEGVSTDVVFTDTLPTGLEFIDVGGTDSVVHVSFVGNLETDSDLSDGDPGSCAVDAAAPTETLPGGRVTLNGQTATFTLGDITNTAATPGAGEPACAIIEYNAIVTDIVTNTAGTTLDNSFTVASSGSTSEPATARVTVVEPELTIEKATVGSPGALDIGDQFEFVVELENAADSGAAAYQLILNDTLPAGLEFIEGHYVIPGLVGVDFDNPAHIDLTEHGGLAPSNQVRLTYRVRVTDALADPFGAVLENRITFTAASLPEPEPGERNDTGSTTPVEYIRDTYTGNDSATVTLAAPIVGLAKALTAGPSTPVVGADTDDDGLYDLTLTFVVSNEGIIPLTNVTVTDDLSVTFPFGSGVTVVDTSVESVVLPPAGTVITGAPNTDYGSADDINLINPIDLGVGQSAVITLNVQVQLDDADVLGLEFLNTAYANATTPGGIPAEERESNDGSDPDVVPDPEPTPIVFAEIATIQVDKELTSSAELGDGSFRVDYLITVENTSEVPLRELRLIDDLMDVYGADGIVHSVSPVLDMPSADSSTVTLNTAYDGGTETELFAPGSWLAAGASQSVQLEVHLTPANSDVNYTNTATATGVSPLGQEPQDSDSSIDGFPVNPALGATICLPAGGIVPVAGVTGRYELTFTVQVRNWGDIQLNNVQAELDLDAAFDDADAFTVVTHSGPEGVVNPDFGPTDWNLLLPGITLYTEDQVIADPDRSSAHSFTVTMEVVPGTELEYELQAAAEGWSPLFPVGEDGRVTVLSTSGCDVDTEPVTEDPTPVNFSNSPLIGVAKEFTSLAAVDGQPGTFDIVFDFVLRNYGSVPLTGIELIDDLHAIFAAEDPADYTITGITATAPLVAADVADANSDFNLLDPLSQLGTVAQADADILADTGTVTLTIRVTPVDPSGDYFNTATGAGDGPEGSTTTDRSTDGDDPDPEGDGPGDNDDPTPFTFETPIIGLAKSVPAEYDFGDGLEANPRNLGTGQYEIGYLFTIVNYGDVPLSDLMLFDDLEAQLVDGNPVAYRAGTGTLTYNTAYDGTAGVSVVAPGQTLPYSDAELTTETAGVIVTVEPGTNLASGTLVLENLALAQGTSPGGNTVTDTSNEGIDPDNGQPDGDDPANDGDGDPTNNEGPTTVTLTEAPQVAIAKSLSAEPVNYGTGTYGVEFTFTLANTGDVDLSAVTLTDDLSAAFRGSLYVITGLTAEAPLVAIDVADAQVATQFLAAGSNLPVGATRTVTLTMDVTPGARIYGGPFENLAEAAGTSPAGVTVDDISNDGTDPEPGVTDPTEVLLEEDPVLGVAKSFNGFTNVTTGVYRIDFTFTMVNAGDVDLHNVQLFDDLDAAFRGSPYTLVSLTADAPLTASALADAAATGFLLDAGSSTLAVGESATVNLVLDIVPGDRIYDGAFQNEALGTATSPGELDIEDPSNDGDTPIPGEDTPTPVVILEDPVIGLAKSAEVTPLGDGRYDVLFTFTIRNYGTAEANAVEIRNVQLTDSLDDAFGAGTYRVQSLYSPTLTVNTPAPDPTNPAAYDGSANLNLLAGTDTLDVGETATVQLHVTVTPPEARSYENLAHVEGRSPGDEPVRDTSTNGDDPDPDGDDDPTNNDEPTPVPFTENPLIGLAKNATVVANADGSFNIELLFTLRNMGDVPLHNVRLTDPLDGIYADTDLSADRISVRSSVLTYNPGYDGAADADILAGTDTMPVDAERTVSVILRNVRPTGATSTTNSAVAHGDSPTGSPVNDRSTDGFEPDPNGDDIPDEEVPTPIVLERITQIALAKSGALSIADDGTTLTLVFTFTAQNTGNVPLHGVQVSDGLAEYYASTNLTARMITVGSTDFTVNPAFDGATDDHLLIGTDSLAVGETGSVTLTMTGFTANAGVTELANSALADGRGPDGTPTEDPSNDGNTPVPGEDVPTITPLTENPLLGVAKEASVAVAADGTYTVTFDFAIGNYGNVTLRNLSLTDDLSAFAAAGMTGVTVTSTDFPVNGSFNGTTDPELLGAGATLAVGDYGRLTLVLQGVNGPGSFTNQAAGGGESPSGTPTPPELSTDGPTPDPDGDGIPDEEVPTPVILESNPLLGVAKSATVVQNADLSYSVTFDILLRNMGNTHLSNLQVHDSLAQFYASTDLTAAAITVSSADLTPNPAFDGDTDTALLTGSDTLAIGAEATVTITLDPVRVPAPVTLTNVATGDATAPDGTPTEDDSTDGDDPDPNGDGIPDEDTPTPVILAPQPRIGIAKSAEVTANDDGSFDLVFDFVVGNYGNTVLHNVQVRDDLSVFYGPTDISAAHMTITSADFSANPGYNGLTDLRLLTGTDTLGTGESGTLTLTIAGLRISEPVDTFNTAIATGTDPGGNPTPPDRSTDGDDPDPDGDGDPGNNNDPTPVRLGERPLIGLAKSAETVNNGDGSYDITFTLTVRNYSDVPLFDLTLTDPLDQFYANTNLTAARVSTGSSTLTLNAAYDGASDTELLASGNSLGVGEDAIVTIALSNVVPNAGVTRLDNSALVTGTAPDGNETSDTSTAGDDPDPDGSGPGNHSTPTPVYFDGTLAMLLDKTADPGPYMVGDRVTYTVTITNPNDVPTAFTLTDEMPPATEYVAATAAFDASAIAPSEGSEPRHDEPGVLTWRAVVLPAGDSVTVTYDLRILPGAVSPLVNTASIMGTGVSAQSNAAVELDQGVFDLDTGMLIGRVYLDVNRNDAYDEGVDVPLENARVVLANGWQTLTDEQGNYAFRELDSGTWTVMVDQVTAPYQPTDHPEQLRDPRQHRVHVQGVTVSDFPFTDLAGLASVRRETTVSFGPIEIHKYQLLLGDTVRVVIEVSSEEAWPPLLITDPVPGGDPREFVVELTGDEPVFLTYDLPAGTQLTDPEIEWSNR